MEVTPEQSNPSVLDGSSIISKCSDPSISQIGQSLSHYRTLFRQLQSTLASRTQSINGLKSKLKLSSSNLTKAQYKKHMKSTLLNELKSKLNQIQKNKQQHNQNSVEESNIDRLMTQHELEIHHENQMKVLHQELKQREQAQIEFDAKVQEREALTRELLETHTKQNEISKTLKSTRESLSHVLSHSSFTQNIQCSVSKQLHQLPNPLYILARTAYCFMESLRDDIEVDIVSCDADTTNSNTDQQQWYEIHSKRVQLKIKIPWNHEEMKSIGIVFGFVEDWNAVVVELCEEESGDGLVRIEDLEELLVVGKDTGRNAPNSVVESMEMRFESERIGKNQRVFGWAQSICGLPSFGELDMYCVLMKNEMHSEFKWNVFRGLQSSQSSQNHDVSPSIALITIVRAIQNRIAAIYSLHAQIRNQIQSSSADHIKSSVEFVPKMTLCFDHTTDRHMKVIEVKIRHACGAVLSAQVGIYSSFPMELPQWMNVSVDASMIEWSEQDSHDFVDVLRESAVQWMQKCVENEQSSSFEPDKVLSIQLGAAQTVLDSVCTHDSVPDMNRNTKSGRDHSRLESFRNVLFQQTSQDLCSSTLKERSV
mmetsp:Transcript_12112/g.21897  ORF Transcript_12112/g.21897 Transcript_12112/m.21897 type:complete len:594 (-) Transcript_12112:1610-3391(-)